MTIDNEVTKFGAFNNVNRLDLAVRTRARNTKIGQKYYLIINYNPFYETSQPLPEIKWLVPGRLRLIHH